MMDGERGATKKQNGATSSRGGATEADGKHWAKKQGEGRAAQLV